MLLASSSPSEGVPFYFHSLVALQRPLLQHVFEISLCYHWSHKLAAVCNREVTNQRSFCSDTHTYHKVANILCIVESTESAAACYLIDDDDDKDGVHLSENSDHRFKKRQLTRRSCRSE